MRLVLTGLPAPSRLLRRKPKQSQGRAPLSISAHQRGIGCEWSRRCAAARRARHQPAGTSGRRGRRLVPWPFGVYRRIVARAAAIRRCGALRDGGVWTGCSPGAPQLRDRRRRGVDEPRRPVRSGPRAVTTVRTPASASSWSPTAPTPGAGRAENRPDRSLPSAFPPDHSCRRWRPETLRF